MSVKRIVAIGCIFVLACTGWWILGTATAVRSHGFGNRLRHQVEGLWGQPLVQQAPSFSVQIPGSEAVRWLMPARNDLQVRLSADHRKKGLIWYPTYVCDFEGVYTVANNEEVSQTVRLQFLFPAARGTYDNFSMALDGQPLDVPIDTENGIAEIMELGPGQSREFRVTYRTRGLRDWRYRPDPRVGRIRNLTLDVRTGFKNIDYTEGSLSATETRAQEGGLLLRWKASDLITRKDIGIVIPERLNPGPLTSRITFFAPVCLLFFFVLVATINVMYGLEIHPMHYLFVAAGFFAFHLLLDYMVGHVHVHLSFLTSALLSVTLVTSYLRAALGPRFPWRVGAAGQVFFLVLFSYSFFIRGITGLTVAVGSIVTLAVLMRVTAHVDWNRVFARPRGKVKPALPVSDPPAPAVS